MKILLVANVFSEGCTGLLVLKNLNQMGHTVSIWDTRISVIPPPGEFDLSITWTNETPDISLIKSKIKILYYLEDTDYIGMIEDKYKIENQIRGYDYFYTMNLLQGYEDHWLPMGADEEVFYSITMPIMGDVLFIGTARDDRRKKIITDIQQKLHEQNINLWVMGNGWEDTDHNVGKAYYFNNMAKIVNSFKIVINLHIYGNSPSDKVHNINGCGGALLINDSKQGYNLCYPNSPVWMAEDDLIEKIQYYLTHEDKRKEKVTELQNRANTYFSYTRILNIMLDLVQTQ